MAGLLRLRAIRYEIVTALLRKKSEFFGAVGYTINTGEGQGRLKRLPGPLPLQSSVKISSHTNARCAPLVWGRILLLAGGYRRLAQGWGVSNL